MVLQGSNDPRVLQVESDEMVEAIKAAGVPVEYVIFRMKDTVLSRRRMRLRLIHRYLNSSINTSRVPGMGYNSWPDAGGLIKVLLQ